MKNYFQGQKILITGGTGAFGTKFCQYLIKSSAEKISIISRDEMKHAAMKRLFSGTNSFPGLNYKIADITKPDELHKSMNDIDIVVHAAAMKHLPECESNPEASNRINIQGTENVINAFIASNAHTLVFLSTDKAPYASSIYGAQKYIGEKLITSCALENKNKRAFSLRYSNVIDSTGAVFHIFGNLLTQGKKITVNGRDTVRGFVTQADVISCLETSLQNLKGGEVVLLKPQIIQIAELATTMQKLIGKGEAEVLETQSFQGEKDSATLIMEEELKLAKIFPEAKIEAYILDFLQRHDERPPAPINTAKSMTLADCNILSGKALNDFLIPVMQNNNINIYQG